MKKRWILLFGIGVFVLLLVIFFSFLREDKIVMKNFVGKDFTLLQKFADDVGIRLKVEYRYDEEVESNQILSQSILGGKNFEVGDVCSVVVSKGKIPVELYSQYGVNELGRVPIMMYHGIVNVSSNDTSYVGGNVDFDGYQRTTAAFRQDLEFYYENDYRMIRLKDFIDGVIDVELGKSPIILTFDDGSENNFKVLGEKNGELVIDPNCAVGILEEFKKKYSDYGVTATFFLNSSLFSQKEYDEKILKWLVQHGYDIGNHTMNHVDFTKIDHTEVAFEVGGMYQLLETLIPSSYVEIVALPFGSPYRMDHENFLEIMDGVYEGIRYHTKAALRVGWEAELSCFDVEFNPIFLKRIRAYDNLGKEFDIEMNFQLLESNRYISDGDMDVVVVKDADLKRVASKFQNVISYS